MELRIKILTFFIVPYLFCCAGLYQLAYYNPFKVNVFSFLDVADIVKSVIAPFLVSSFIAIFSTLLNFPTHDMAPYIVGEKRFFENKYLRVFAHLIMVFYPLLIMLLVFHYRDDRWKGIQLPWLFVPLIYYIAITALHQLKIRIDTKYTAFILYFLIVLPVICFESGTKNAKNIYDNQEFDYSTEIMDNKPLKFLGKASTHYIFTTIDNKENYYFGVDKLSGLHLRHFMGAD